jgi:hypothetical protein
MGDVIAARVAGIQDVGLPNIDLLRQSSMAALQRVMGGEEAQTMLKKELAASAIATGASATSGLYNLLKLGATDPNKSIFTTDKDGKKRLGSTVLNALGIQTEDQVAARGILEQLATYDDAKLESARGDLSKFAELQALESQNLDSPERLTELRNERRAIGARLSKDMKFGLGDEAFDRALGQVLKGQELYTKERPYQSQQMEITGAVELTNANMLEFKSGKAKTDQAGSGGTPRTKE